MEGLFVCLKAVLDYVGVSDWDKKLISFGCDGVSVNIGARGLRDSCRHPCLGLFFCALPIA